jgi:hypothetical protein
MALIPGCCFAQTQSTPGAGNQTAVQISRKSAMVQSAYKFLIGQAEGLVDSSLRAETFDAIANPQTCIEHRANLDDAKRQAILNELISAGLVNVDDGKNIPGGLIAGVFPGVLNDNTDCPRLPQPFSAAPGSSFGGHHSYPGGLPVHESNNDTADINLAREYRLVYGHDNQNGVPTINAAAIRQLQFQPDSSIGINQDIIVGAPLWHDWAKPIVFQWNADGTEFQELNFGGNGSTDNYGAAGDSRTGGHHILGIAEAMKRGLSPAFVITQASAHSAPTSGNEYKVVNWLRAAAIIAQIDPVQCGYLTKDKNGNYRLPALRELGDVDLLAAGQTNILVEYELHNLSDADFTFSGPAVAGIQVVLADVAPSFGFDPTDTTRYNTKFRNKVLSNFTAEHLFIIYTNRGRDGVKAEIQKLVDAGTL